MFCLKNGVISMANQYSNNFKMVVESKYNRSIESVLKDFAYSGLSIFEVAEKEGFKSATVKKYGDRYNVIFKSNTKPIKKDNSNVIDLKQQLKMAQINSINALSKKWPNFSI